MRVCDSLSLSLSLSLLQFEGCFDEAYIRSSKAYYLRNHGSLEAAAAAAADGESNVGGAGRPVKKLRSIERKYHSALGADIFSQDPSLSSGIVRGQRMGPTPGYEILVTAQSKTLAKNYNLTRVQQVSVCVAPTANQPPMANAGAKLIRSSSSSSKTTTTNRCLPFSFQDCCHSICLK